MRMKQISYPYQLKDPGIVLLGVEVRKDQSLDATRDEMLKTIDELSARPPTKEEVERASQGRNRIE